MATENNGDGTEINDDSAVSSSGSTSSGFAAPSGAGQAGTQGSGAQGAPQYGQPAPQYGQYAPPSSGAPAHGGPAYGQPAPPSGAPTPQYGQPAPQYGQQTPQYGQPQYGQTPQYGAPQGAPSPQYGAPPQGGSPYGPPPTGFQNFNASFKPGIIPLRPLSLGEIYDGAFGAIRKAPGPLLGLTSLIVGFFVALAVIVGYVIAPWLTSTSLGTEFNYVLRELDTLYGGGAANTFSIAILISLVVPIATIVATAVVVVAVGNLVVSSKVSASETWMRVSKRLGGIIGVSIMVSVVPGIVYFGVFVLLLFMMSAFDFAAGTVLLGMVGMVAATVYFLYLQMRWIFAAAVLVLEERKVIDSMKRSFQVSKGSFWRIVGYYLLTNMILSLAVGMVSGVIEIIATAALGLDTLLVTWYGLIVYALIQTLTLTVTVGALSAVVTLLYVDIRMRREGLDIELIAAAQKQ